LSKPSQGASRRPTAEEQATVSYPEIRDRFLATSSEGDYAIWLACVGRFVHHCWLAEEQSRNGSELNEDATKHLWDQLTEKQLIDLRIEADDELKEHRKRRIRYDLATTFSREALPTVVRAAVWALRTVWEHFIGGLGLVILGILIAWAAPHVVKMARSAADELLPADTAPAHFACPAGHTHTSDPEHC